MRGERRADQAEAIAGVQAAATKRSRGRIAVEGDHGGAGGEKGAAVAAGAEGAVDQGQAGRRSQGLDHLGQQDGDVRRAGHAQAAPALARRCWARRAGQALAGDGALFGAVGLEGLARPDLEAVAQADHRRPSRSGRTARTGSPAG